MSFFDEMKESLVSAGKDVSQKAKEVSGVAKLKLDVKSKEDYVEKQYAELGRTYFDAHRDDEENAENEQFKVIKEALAEIERMKTEILNLQGAAECPNCGARMPQGHLSAAVVEQKWQSRSILQAKLSMMRNSTNKEMHIIRLQITMHRKCKIMQ